MTEALFLKLDEDGYLRFDW